MNNINKDVNNKSNNIKEDLLLYNYKDLSITILKQSSNNKLSIYSHSHPDYEFIIPITPIPYLLINGRLCYCECGMVYPIQSGEIHGIKYELNNVSIINILINKEFLEDSLSKILDPKGIQFTHEFEITQRLNILMNLFKEEATSKYQCNEVLKHLSELICLELGKCGLTYTKAKEYKSNYPSISSVKESSDYIINNIHKEISIDELASLCNLSRFHYIRMFKQCFGDTPHNYLTKVRLSVAKLLLENTQLPLTEISSKCGFNSPNRFSEIFKLRNNISPSEYRKIYSKNYNLNIVNSLDKQLEKTTN